MQTQRNKKSTKKFMRACVYEIFFVILRPISITDKEIIPLNI